MKPKLLVVELWGLGDLVIATPFLRAACERFAVTLLAKPYAKDLQQRLWQAVNVVPFVAPWTAFKHKYRLLRWPWRKMRRLRSTLAAEKFDFGLSARWDPRDHLLLQMVRARHRLGFPRMGSRRLLTESLQRPPPDAHRYESWRLLARAMDFELPARENLALPRPAPGSDILVHTGAGQPVRVWPLERYMALVIRLRTRGYRVQVVCDTDQQGWWTSAGEPVATPRTVTDLLALLDRAGAFIGNDSGPGHLAAFTGLPTFTLFGPQLPEWFAPLHPGSRWLEGHACPYKPCSDYCRFPCPICMTESSVEEVASAVERFLGTTLPLGLAPSTSQAVPSV